MFTVRLCSSAGAQYSAVNRSLSEQNTENVTLGTLIEERRIRALPLNGRDFFNLVALVERKDAAGVVTSYAYDNLNRRSGKTGKDLHRRRAGFAHTDPSDRLT